MTDWHELPSFMLEPPESADVVCCQECNEMLLQGGSIFSYVSNYAGWTVDFCSTDCAVEYFLKHDLEEGEVV